MATTKPTKPSITLPSAFGTSASSVKTEYTSSELQTGYSASIQQVLDGGNFNYLVDLLFQGLTYCYTFADWLKNSTANTVPYINSSNQLDYTAISPVGFSENVDISNPTNNQALVYDSATSKWKNGTIESLPTQTGNSGKFLTTNGTAASWVNVIDCGTIT